MKKKNKFLSITDNNENVFLNKQIFILIYLK